MPMETDTTDLIARARAGDHDAFRDPHASVYRAYALLLVTTAGDHITAITGFTPNIMTRFGLPRTLPETD